MIVARAPLRVSFLGGGTDFPWFLEREEGAVVSAAIDKFIYVVASQSFDLDLTLLRYSRTEVVHSFDKVRHPIFREALSDYRPMPLDISVHSDLPSGNGLGSSSSFTVATVALLEQVNHGFIPDHSEIACKAIEIEIDKLGEPIGIQDQLASAFGGLRMYKFQGKSKFSNVDLLSDRQFPFQISLIKIGPPSRNASHFTSLQAKHASENPSAWAALKDLANLTLEAGRILLVDFSLLPSMINEAWKLKKISNPSATSDQIESILSFALKNGALAGKLLGAGGGGYLMLLSQDSHHLHSRIQKTLKLNPISVNIEKEGVKTWTI